MRPYVNLSLGLHELTRFVLLSFGLLLQLGHSGDLLWRIFIILKLLPEHWFHFPDVEVVLIEVFAPFIVDLILNEIGVLLRPDLRHLGELLEGLGV